MQSCRGFGLRRRSPAMRVVRSGRTLRYGTVYALQKADCDLYRALERAADFDTGERHGVRPEHARPCT
eukprot:4835244-Prymnesium_polylepis.1